MCMYSQLQMRWSHRLGLGILRMFLYLFNLVPGVPGLRILVGFIISTMLRVEFLLKTDITWYY